MHKKITNHNYLLYNAAQFNNSRLLCISQFIKKNIFQSYSVQSKYAVLGAPYNKKNREQRIENKNFNLSETVYSHNT